ncbi:MAG TPA: hypothetical protein VFU31_19260 [Candidatus Binatia bacterium]|nr:hypothetical protein [Candidatus Binatia bacterium]
MRYRQNFRTVDRNKLQRAQGFRKLLATADPYNNEDLHDQLLSLTLGVRQPITLIFESESSRKQKSLFVATEGSIYALNNSTGNWSVLGSGYGQGGVDATGPRFKAARQGDYVIFTNDYNPPMYHVLEQGTSPLIREIDDLETIGLTKARHVWTWKNVVFFADVEMDQQRFPFRVVWGDFDNPTSFDPEKAESIAGTFDLNENEQILGGMPLGNVFLIYTTHGIWEMSVTGGEESFSFREAYPGNRFDFLGCLYYPETLINLGESHMYLGKDKIYTFNPYQQTPTAPEWVHAATKELFDNIDSGKCGVHIGHLDGDEAYFSYATSAAVAGCPDKTIRINKRYEVVDTIDAGFTAFAQFTPGSSPTIRDFILDNDICTVAQLDAEGFLFGNEGLPREIDGEDAAFEPQVIHTANPIHLGGTLTVAGAGTAAANTIYTYNAFTKRYVAPNGYYIERTNPTAPDFYGVETLHNDAGLSLYSNPLTLDGAWATVTNGTGPAPTVTPDGDVLTVEDYEQATSDSDSLCALLNGQRLDDICRVCPSNRLFVAAFSDDWCLKQMNSGFAREKCTNPTATGETGDYGYSASVGEYEDQPYDSILRFGTLYNKDGDVIVERFQINYIAKPAVYPDPTDPTVPEVTLYIGASSQPMDPNTATRQSPPCGIVWHTRSTQEMKCLSNLTASQHLAAQSQPSLRADWNFWHTAPYIYVELFIEGTGANVEFSGVAGDVSLKATKNG